MTSRHLSTSLLVMSPVNDHLDYARSADHMQDGDPIGQREMAELTGRNLKSIYAWHGRHHLPLADGPVVNGLPTWRRRTFLAWAFREGFTVTHEDKVPLPCHLEAAGWASEVDPETVRPLRDLERRAARAS